MNVPADRIWPPCLWVSETTFVTPSLVRYFKRRPRTRLADRFRVNAPATRPGRSRFAACVRALRQGLRARRSLRVGQRSGVAECLADRRGPGHHRWRGPRPRRCCAGRSGWPDGPPPSRLNLPLAHPRRRTHAGGHTPRRVALGRPGEVFIWGRCCSPAFPEHSPPIRKTRLRTAEVQG